MLLGRNVGLGAQALTLPCPSPLSLSRPHGAQAPRLKAVLTHSSSGESSGQRTRGCPFRVRFADETLRDTALRYWERSRAGKQTGQGEPRTPESSSLEPREQRLWPWVLGVRAGLQRPGIH